MISTKIKNIIASIILIALFSNNVLANYEYDIPVTVIMEPSTFSITVPSYLPLSIDKDGKSTSAQNVYIENTGESDVQVVGLSISSYGDWRIVDWDTADSSIMQIDSKQVAFIVNGQKTNDAGEISFDSNDFSVISRDGGRLYVDYDCIISKSSVAVHEQIATISFIFGVANSLDDSNESDVGTYDSTEDDIEDIDLGGLSDTLDANNVAYFNVGDQTDLNNQFNWESANQNIIYIDGNMLYAINPGETTIYNEYGYEVKVNVSQPLYGIDITIDEVEITVDSEFLLKVVYNPGNTTEGKNITWSTSDESVVSVYNGLIVGNAPGVAVITATVGIHTATCTVVVSDMDID